MNDTSTHAVDPQSALLQAIGGLNELQHQLDVQIQATTDIERSSHLLQAGVDLSVATLNLGAIFAGTGLFVGGLFGDIIDGAPESAAEIKDLVLEAIGHLVGQGFDDYRLEISAAELVQTFSTLVEAGLA